MGKLPVVLLLCSFHALTAGAQSQQTEITEAPTRVALGTLGSPNYSPRPAPGEVTPASHSIVSRDRRMPTTEAPGGSLPANCREEMYACTRMYSVHRPIKRCIGGFCLYSLPRVYVINNEICMRTVCPHDEYLKAERCREWSGWPRRIERSNNRRRCPNRRSNPNTWANKA